MLLFPRYNHPEDEKYVINVSGKYKGSVQNCELFGKGLFFGGYYDDT